MRRLIVLILILLLTFSMIGVAYAELDRDIAGSRAGVFLAWLTGAEEVPPVETDAIGLTIFKVNRARSAVHYTILVHDIEEVIAAHIHCAPPGVNGPVGVTLFGGETVTPDNLLVSGRFREPDPGNACGWTTLADVLAAIRSGNAYVNVHTTANPGGEIRGQVEPFSHES